MDINGHTPLYEDYVSFEVAKLLKKKGFNEATYGTYSLEGDLSLTNPDINWNEKDLPFIAAPTLQMAIKWLRKIHNIFIQLDYVYSSKELYMYTFDIHNMKSARSIFSTPYGESFNSYEKACEAAIKYCLTNLIK